MSSPATDPRVSRAAGVTLPRRTNPHPTGSYHPSRMTTPCADCEPGVLCVKAHRSGQQTRRWRESQIWQMMQMVRSSLDPSFDPALRPNGRAHRLAPGVLLASGGIPAEHVVGDFFGVGPSKSAVSRWCHLWRPMGPVCGQLTKALGFDDDGFYVRRDIVRLARRRTRSLPSGDWPCRKPSAKKPRAHHANLGFEAAPRRNGVFSPGAAWAIGRGAVASRGAAHISAGGGSVTW